MRQGNTRCEICGQMRAASYSACLELWLCSECACAKLESVMDAALEDRRAYMPDQAQGLRNALQGRR
jgi:hypothetical protein